jgi:hypothetical protein
MRQVVIDVRTENNRALNRQTDAELEELRKRFMTEGG